MHQIAVANRIQFFIVIGLYMQMCNTPLYLSIPIRHSLFTTSNPTVYIPAEAETRRITQSISNHACFGTTACDCCGLIFKRKRHPFALSRFYDRA